MDYVVEKDGSSITTKIKGKLSLEAHDEFSNLLASLFAEKAPAYVIDLGGVDYIDSTGLGMLLLARDKAQSVGASISLRGAQGDVLHSLNIAKIDTLFSMQ